MGIIARQTIKGSVYSYLGAAIGFINVGLIMPQIFSTEQIGLTNLLIAVVITSYSIHYTKLYEVDWSSLPFCGDGGAICSGRGAAGAPSGEAPVPDGTRK